MLKNQNLNNLFGIYDRKDTADLTHVLDTSIFGMHSAQSTSNVPQDVKFWQIMHFLHQHYHIHLISGIMEESNGINAERWQPIPRSGGKNTAAEKNMYAEQRQNARE